MSNDNRRPVRPLRNPNAQGVLMLVIVLLVAAIYIMNNRQTQQTVSLPSPPATNTTEALQDWQVALQAELNTIPTPTLTASPSPTQFIQPTPTTLPPTVFQPDTVQVSPLATTSPLPTQVITFTPEFIDATAVPLPQGVDVAAAAPFQDAEEKYQLPPEQIPLSAHPFDHYYLTRPIDVTANSQYLFYYPYGSDGEGWRVHHGLDLPNRIGQEVQAAGPGTVVCASRTIEASPQLECDSQAFVSYGNVIIIEHDFGWRGQPVWTLYAHLSAILVNEGDHVEMGDVIGLVGATGFVSGPHVHFEVRLGSNTYYGTRNPLLWMAPYIGHGVIAGRVVDADGAYIDNAQVQLNQAGRVLDNTSTYMNPYVVGKEFWNVVPDDNWGENFVLGDVAAGDYQVVVVVDGNRLFQNVRVNAGITTYVDFTYDDAATPQAFDDLGTPATAIVPTQGPTGLPSATPQ